LFVARSPYFFFPLGLVLAGSANWHIEESSDCYAFNFGLMQLATSRSDKADSGIRTIFNSAKASADYVGAFALKS
jgi:hypothetical protein